MSSSLETIKSGSQLIALIIRSSFKPKKHQFLTQDDNPLQLGVLKFSQNDQVKPHLHRHITKTAHLNQEFLYLTSGKLQVSFFNSKKKLLSTTTLNPGDCLLQISGGHGFKALKPCQLITIKQGPYHSTTKEKIIIP